MSATATEKQTRKGDWVTQTLQQEATKGGLDCPIVEHEKCRVFVIVDPKGEEHSVKTLTLGPCFDDAEPTVSLLADMMGEIETRAEGVMEDPGYEHASFIPIEGGLDELDTAIMNEIRLWGRKQRSLRFLSIMADNEKEKGEPLTLDEIRGIAETGADYPMDDNGVISSISVE